MQLIKSSTVDWFHWKHVTKIHHSQCLEHVECWSNLSHLRFDYHVGQRLVNGWSKVGQNLDKFCRSQSMYNLWPRVKVPDNLSHFSRHDLAYFEARSSILLYMRVSILDVIPQFGSISKSRSANFLSLTLTLSNVMVKSSPKMHSQVTKFGPR